MPGGYGIVEGGVLPYRPEALAKRKENYEKRAEADPEASCYLPGVPRVTYMPYPFQIIQFRDFPDTVTILYEYLGTTRTIFLNRKTHPDPEVLDFWMGDSVGHWEGDTLVVDVNNFNDKTWFDRAGNYHGYNLHVVERYTRTGPDTMTYEATIEDSKTFTRPWKITVPIYQRQERNLRLLETSTLHGGSVKGTSSSPGRISSSRSHGPELTIPSSARSATEASLRRGRGSKQRDVRGGAPASDG